MQQPRRRLNHTAYRIALAGLIGFVWWAQVPETRAQNVNSSGTGVGHVGTGFMRPLETSKKPFDQKVKYENDTTWLIPKLVGEVKFSEWTSDGEMRHPVFLELRTDKEAFDVIREQA